MSRVGAEEGQRYVALAGVADHGHDPFSLHLRTAGDDQRGPGVGARGDACGDVLDTRQLLRGGDGVVVADRDELVDHRPVDYGRDEAGADPLDPVWARTASGQDRRAGWL